MAWIMSTVNKAVEVGGGTVRSYADSVVSQAGRVVVGGAKILQDRITTRNFQSFKHNVKRLEEVAVSCRGLERVLLLRRWVISLKEVDKLNKQADEISGKGPEQLNASNESTDSPRKPVLVLYSDPDIGGEPMTFRDVFLHSQALEGMTLSMILEPPNEEEVKLLLDIYGLCLAGGGEVHSATMSSLQDLANAFASYNEEVLAKREELLQYAQSAIAGLKINAEIARIDSEVLEIQKNLDEMKLQTQSEDHDKSSEHMTIAPLEYLKESVAQVQLCSRLEALLLKKKLLKNGDSPNMHAKKVDKLKVLSESLANSASKTERRILDHRSQKEEALRFRVAKTTEFDQTQKELVSEIGTLERQRDELEAQLKKVNTSITAARLRLHNAREERDQFDEASNDIVAHLKTKDDELSRSIACYRAEADVCNMFVNFLQDTWTFQSKFTEQTEKVLNDELEKHEAYFKDLVISLLSAYKEEVCSSIFAFSGLVERLISKERADIVAAVDDENPFESTSRKNLEEVYLSSEAKFRSAFNVVESIKKEFYSSNEKLPRHEDETIKELFNRIEKVKEEFESIERPKLETETPKIKDIVVTPKAWLLSSISTKFDPMDRTSSGGYTPMHTEESPENSPPPISPDLATKFIERSNMDLEISNQTKPKQSSSEKVESVEISKAENENPTQVVTSPLIESSSQAKHDEMCISTATKDEKISKPDPISLKLESSTSQAKHDEVSQSPATKEGKISEPDPNSSKLGPSSSQPNKHDEVSQSPAVSTIKEVKISEPEVNLSKPGHEMEKDSKEAS